MALMKIVTPPLVAVLCVALAGPAFAEPSACGFEKAFDRPNEQGTRTVHVYRGSASAEIGDVKPFAFVVPRVKVNTDGTRISYHKDDPRAQSLAINDIRNAFRNPHRPISDFEEIRDAGWQPTSKVWEVLSPKIIEKDTRSETAGQPCMDSKGYLVSMTAEPARDKGHQGDCDQTKWIDALTVPAAVLPENSQFEAGGAKVRNVVVALTLDEPRRMALGIVGDTGPENDIGEASVAMNRILNGLPEGANPSNHSEADNKFQGPRSILLVLPGEKNRAPRPLDAASVKAFAEARLNAWGGRERLEHCLSEIPEAN